ncbi:DUF6000 family protein [Streptomyces sp. NPDC046853]|uniref:DUF6000 family protein n=1 Tax=Streptomyces sp. NPDC046853 TaxID=3154920 RepID=UPI0033F93C53
MYVDLNLGHDKAARFLAPNGLWQQWLQGRADGRQAGVHAGTQPWEREMAGSGRG